MPRLKDAAIVLYETDWSETSQLVTLLTESHGKVRGLAKGCKRQAPSSVQRFAGGFELLTLGQIVGMLKPATGLSTFTEWDLHQPHAHLRRDYDALNLGLYAVDLGNALLADHDPHPATFAALRDLLPALAEPAQHQSALLRFHVALLNDTGLAPRLDADAHTGQALPESTTYLFDAQAGGLVSDSPTGEGPPAQGPWRVRPETIALLRQAWVGPDAPDRAAAPDICRRANRLLCAYLRCSLDRELPTMRHLLA